MSAESFLEERKNFVSASATVADGTVLCRPVRLYGAVRVASGCEVGKYTYMGHGTYLSIGTRIGSYCSIARFVEIGAIQHPTSMLSCHPFQYNQNHVTDVPGYTRGARLEMPTPPPTRIGHDVWLGAKSAIRRGLEVGTGAVVGAGAIVTKDVPPYAVVAGTPARILRYRFEAPLIERLLDSRWWELEPHDMDGVPFDDVPTALEEIAARRRRLAAKNREYMAGPLSNSGSGSAKGIAWIAAPHPYLDEGAIRDGMRVRVTAVDPDSGFKGRPTRLAPGEYELRDAGFDRSRGWYRARLFAGGTTYDGPLGKGTVHMQILR